MEQTSAAVYDAVGRVTADTDALGNTTAYTYQFGGDTDAVTTLQGQTLAAVSGSATFNNVAQVPAAERTFTIFVQSSTAPVSGETTVTDSNSGGPAFSFSGSATTPLGSGWYELGTVTLAIGDTSSSVTVTYSGSGVTQVALVSQSSLDTYDADGNLLTDVDALGNTTTYVYNDLGQPAQVEVDSEPPELGPVFDKAGNVASTTDLMGNVTTFGYDAFGDQVSQSLPNPATGLAGGPTTTDIYDADGELLSQTDPLNNVTSYSYDFLGDQVGQSLPVPATGAAGGPTTTLTYDLDGDQLSLTDPDSNTTSWTYDAFGDEISQSEKVALGYTSGGAIQTTTATSSCQYDADGNVVESIDADGRAITYSYNSAGQEAGETWYPTAADAAAGTGSDGSVSFAYDVDGDTTAASNTAGTSVRSSRPTAINTIRRAT